MFLPTAGFVQVSATQQLNVVLLRVSAASHSSPKSGFKEVWRKKQARALLKNQGSKGCVEMGCLQNVVAFLCLYLTIFLISSCHTNVRHAGKNEGEYQKHHTVVSLGLGSEPSGNPQGCLEVNPVSHQHIASRNPFNSQMGLCPK